ncbi:ankyrin repeat domain-containing protein [Rhabdochlamydiaceae symbiont of Dictyostelium giganteum]|uniref:ankyrin repeat domain-containing protein n=1 Tax=Rhabdochlamydiaceae symbiont of Dictyostelium giganteum TaxID=3342349 RepID=UPI00384DB049
MVLPIQKDFNNLSAMIERKEKEELDHRSRIAAIDQVMRERIQLNDDLINCQIEIVQDLLATPLETRDFTRVSDAVHQKLEVIREEHIQSFNAILSAREAYVENGQLIDLTREKKDILREQFQTSLAGSLQKFQASLKIDPSTNLQNLAESLKIQREENLATHDQMLDSKTPLTMELDTLADQRQKLREILMGDNATSSMNIWVACQQGNLSYLQEEFDKKWPWQKKDFVNQPNAEGYTPLHIATFSNQLDIAEWLLQNQANPNISDSLGYQPLHYAAKMGNVSLAHALVRSKADVNGKGEYERTPLHMAAHNGKTEVVALLIQNGANINKQTSKEDAKKTPLHDAVIRQKIRTAAILLQNPKLNVDIRDVKNYTPLYHAVLDGSLEIATLILGHSSWKSLQDRQDPNHPSRLQTLIPRENKTEIEQLLKGL